MKSNQKGFVGVLIVILLVIVFIGALCCISFQGSQQVVSGIAYNTTNKHDTTIFGINNDTIRTDTIRALKTVTNVAYDKPVSASSTSTFDAILSAVNDGCYSSRWSSDRNIDSHNTAEIAVFTNGMKRDTSDVDWAHITIDLTQKYFIDSIRLYLYASNCPWDIAKYKQTFGLYVANDTTNNSTTQVWDSIGGGTMTTQLTWQNQ